MSHIIAEKVIVAYFDLFVLLKRIAYFRLISNQKQILFSTHETFFFIVRNIFSFKISGLIGS